MNTRVVGVVALFAIGGLGAAGCGGSGGGGGTPSTKRTFVAPHVFETSGRCARVAAGDVNGDGVADLLVQQDDLSTIQVMLADVAVGSEPLSPRVPLHAVDYRSAGHVLVWPTASDFCIGDLDRDGCPDLVVAGGDANQVGVWRCDSLDREGFLTPVLVSLDCPASRVAVGDVNGDGRPDLVCLDESQGRVRVCVQSATTPLSFTVDTSPPTIGACFGCVCCDLDGDGRLDLVTNRPDLERITVLPLSSATGIISPRDHASGLPTGRCMAVGDVDGDGRLDVCLLAEGGLSLVCLHQLSSKPGTFESVTSPLSIAIDEQGAHVSVPAVQRRGIVTGCGAGGWYCPTNGQGAVAQGIAIDEPGMHVTGMCISEPGLGLADCDGDGRLDVCARCGDGTGDCCISFGSSTVAGGFGAQERHSQGGWTGPLCAVADLDCDGKPDLVGCDPAAHTVNPLYVSPANESTNPLYGAMSTLDLPFSATDVVVDDLDGDGHPDLVCGSSVGVRICWGDATGGFTTPVPAGAQTPLTGVAVGDVNGDGLPDVVAVGVLTQTLLGTTTPRTFTTLNSPGAVPGPACRGLGLGDLDGDGHCDIVAAFDTGARWSRGDGAGGFFAYADVPSGVTNVRGCVPCDLDGDGAMDVCVCGLDACAVVRQDRIPGSSAVTWFPPQPLPMMGGVRVAAGDVNGDGRCDVCVSGADGVLCALQDGSRRGVFLDSHALSLDACGGLAIGDLNGDGRLDLTFVETTGGTLRCRNGGPSDDSPFSLRLNGLPPGEPVIGTLTVVCDLDDDGTLDVVTVAPVLGSTSSTVRTFSRVPPP
jgi:hypothetical protein